MHLRLTVSRRKIPERHRRHLISFKIEKNAVEGLAISLGRRTKLDSAAFFERWTNHHILQRRVIDSRIATGKELCYNNQIKDSY